MIAITENAGKQIRKLITKQGLPESGGLRVGVKAGGCSGYSYVFAWETGPKPTDDVFEGPEGARVFVDRKSHRLLAGTTLDYDTSLISRGFFFDNPNATSTCGCGVSFSA
jgi:iron-sulfur cluster assembly protein